MGKEFTYYTKEGLEKLKHDLHKLKTEGRRDISSQLLEARDKGDLSENAEYDAAKDAQGHLEAKIAHLEELMGKARLIDESKLNTLTVSILSKVTIQNRKNKDLYVYTLVSEEEAHLKSGKISVQSPVGKGLLGKKKGYKGHIKTPAGGMDFEIIKIEL